MTTLATPKGCQKSPASARCRAGDVREIAPYVAAMSAPVLAYENLGLIQGSGWLFRHLDLFIDARDRLALIGRNGAGKTTLLKCLAASIDTDEGRRTIQPGIKVVLL